ncbi:DbpA RNA binding domain-containing protein [Cyclobacterium lianum]|uniref:DbpA RNA binding domain-containing protein n=2 Tax=Cyclobacterium lianum TaxID=388280 RepID=A0A1M7NVR6_9BACT|nr:DbpA RNA binding domain-containing protein [Cyclobacterium lianum]
MPEKRDPETLLQHLPFDTFNTMQQDFIEKTLTSSKPLMLLAPTGSGKTLAYLVPLALSLQKNYPQSTGLIIVPSRELALQIEQVFRSLKTNLNACTCYGGHAFKTEANRLKENPALVIGTPGRLSEHAQLGNLPLAGLEMVVLDEFDKSLQFGFHDQLKVIFDRLDGTQRYFLTSATALESLPEFLPLSSWETLDYLKISSESKLELKLVRTPSVEKAAKLMHLLAGFQQENSLVFCNHREAVIRISTLLSENHFPHETLHGGMEQIDREKSLFKFRSGVKKVLIATDLAARGLDIPEIRHVVHYQLPSKEDAFIHRNGRTARMHASGQSYLVLAHDEPLPDYLPKDLSEFEPPEDIRIPTSSPLACLYISAGKKDKISKGDVVGFLTNKGGLDGGDIGLIGITDTASYVAIPREQVPAVLQKTSKEKMKKIRVKVELAN